MGIEAHQRRAQRLVAAVMQYGRGVHQLRPKMCVIVSMPGRREGRSVLVLVSQGMLCRLADRAQHVAGRPSKQLPTAGGLRGCWCTGNMCNAAETRLDETESRRVTPTACDPYGRLYLLNIQPACKLLPFPSAAGVAAAAGPQQLQRSSPTQKSPQLVSGGNALCTRVE